MPPDELARELIQYAENDLGVRIGFASAATPHHSEAFAEWLAKGYHGEMNYLARSQVLRSDPRNILPEAKTVIAIAVNYNRPNPAIPGQPRIAKYALGRDYHRVLKAKLKAISYWLDQRAPDHKHRACVDSAPILERDFANLAGLGWFGKNTMLIDSRRGSWFFIGLLLTSVELALSKPAVGGCGTCRACVDACPTGAIVHEDGRWQVDARGCVSYLTIEHRSEIALDLQQGIGDWTYGCDVCQEVCPFNEPRPTQPARGLTTTEPGFLAQRAWPTLGDLASLDADQWNAMTLGSAARRAKVEQWRRNAAINLGNARG